MKTLSKKSTATIVILSCLLAVAVASTVILAAFSAVRTSTTTITFAEGLTMNLTPKTSGADIHITADPNSMETAGSFTYSNTGTTIEYDEPVTLDGINAVLNKDGWVAYQITLKEITGTQTDVTAGTLAGAWAQVMDNETPTNSVVFTPADESQNAKNAWKATLTVDASKVTVAVAGNVVTVKFNSKWTSDPNTLTQELFASIVIDGATAGDLNDLAGRKIVADFKIKAETSAASVQANPITFA